MELAEEEPGPTEGTFKVRDTAGGELILRRWVLRGGT